MASAGVHRPAPAEPALSLATGTIARDDVRGHRMAALLEQAGMRNLVVASSAAQLVVLCEGRAPDAVVIACDRLDARHADWIRVVREDLPTARVVVVAEAATQKTVREIVERGADALVREADAERALALAVRVVLTGHVMIPRAFRDAAVKPVLSAREKQVLGMVVMGFSNAEIAGRLYLAESTVKSHLSSAFARLGVRSRHEATAMILDPNGGLGTGILAITPSNTVTESTDA